MRKECFIMKKRICAALLAACLSLVLAVPAWAASPSVSTDEAVRVINVLGIMSGDANGNMNLTSPLTRAEFITMAMKATPGGDRIGQAAASPYPDVPRTHWASGYVEAAVAAGLVSGYTDGTFRPSSRISLAEGVSIVLQLLGYGPSDFSGAYPTGQLTMYRSLKLDRGVSASAAAAPLTRQDAAHLFYNLLIAQTKEGVPYLTTLGYSLNAAGEIDLVSLINDSMEGPVVAQGDWKASIPFETAQATVYRGGKASTLSAVQDCDLVYWNQSTNTIWVYTDQVVGTIQALEPSASTPASVTVAGRTYAIETAAAAYALSNLGQFGLGDTVTLLLGREGGVAAVAAGNAAAGKERVGVVTAITNESYSDGQGGVYTARTATLLATDGQTYRYECKSGPKEGSLVQVTVSDQGVLTLGGISTSHRLSGTVNSSGTKLGSVPFAEDVEILDVSGAYGVRVYPSRLAGLDLTDSVAYYSLNSAGEIDRMILRDATGDMYQYGIMTKIERTPGGEFSDYYSYEFVVNGTVYTLPLNTAHYSVELGPVQVRGSLQNPERFYSLTSTKTGTVSGDQFVVGRLKYALSDSVAVYEYRNGSYYLSTLAQVQEGNFTLTGWYDKTGTQVGRIRVIVAREAG